MRYGKIAVYTLTAVFLAAAVLFGIQDTQPEDGALFSVQISTDDMVQTIDCWEKEDGKFYLFLPSYADLSEVKVRLDSEKSVWIDEQQLREGMSCSGFETDVDYKLSWISGEKTVHSSIVFMKSAAMAAMYIDVPTGSMAYIHAKKGNEESGTFHLYTAEGQLEYAGSMESMKGRGNSSWYTDKKSYSVTLSEEADLLGMGLAQRWVLLSNTADKSNLRNKIVYDFAADVGLEYSPDTQWIDLYLNGEYAGLYLLSERNEVHVNRVDAALEGSFLVSQEMESRLRKQNYSFITTESGQALRIHDNTLDTAELEQIWQSAENAILAEDGIDPVTGKSWQELIDLDSWVRKYLIEEVFGNVDGGFMSQYFYLDGSEEAGRIYAGPVWDYDLAMGNNTFWQQTGQNGFFANRLHVKDGIDAGWFYALYRKEAFYERMRELYQSEFRPLLTELLESGMEEYVAQIDQSARMDQIRWYYESEELTPLRESIRSYMTGRMAFLDDVWLKGTEYCVVQVKCDSNSNYAYCALRPGECLNALPEAVNTASTVFLGWYYDGTEETFDLSQPIWEDTVICGKWTSSLLYILMCVGPASLLAVIFAVLFFVDRRRGKKDGLRKNDRSKHKKIPA